MERLRKAKQDKMAEYPIFWVAGVQLGQLLGTWYQLTWNCGGVFFDRQGNHQLGSGSFGAGKNLYRGPNHHYGLNIANDPAQSPNAGKVKAHG